MAARERKTMTLDKRTKGPAYFGKMAAAMSHELKNCLAIMNENNGLVQDFTHLARSGRPLIRTGSSRWPNGLTGRSSGRTTCSRR